MFGSGDIELMRQIANLHMMDIGYVQVYSSELDEYGDDVVTYTDGALTICGLKNEAGSEYHTPGMTVVTWDAVLRLPIGYEVNEKDRFIITSFRGEPVTMIFEISSPVQIGMTANRVRLKRVEL